MDDALHVRYSVSIHRAMADRAERPGVPFRDVESLVVRPLSLSFALSAGLLLGFGQLPGHVFFSKNRLGLQSHSVFVGAQEISHAHRLKWWQSPQVLPDGKDVSSLSSVLASLTVFMGNPLKRGNSLDSRSRPRRLTLPLLKLIVHALHIQLLWVGISVPLSPRGG